MYKTPNLKMTTPLVPSTKYFFFTIIENYRKLNRTLHNKFYTLYSFQIFTNLNISK